MPTLQANLQVVPGDYSGRDRMRRALQGKGVDRAPIWFMRQAGRYLPEYQAIRREVTFEERLKNPALAAQITLQPLQRFPLDAAILFSDILVPLAGMGHEARFGDDGPRFGAPVRSPEQVDALRIPAPGSFPFVTDALRLVRETVPDHAVLGFAGAPFTLASYLIEGGSSKDFAETKRFAYTHPDAWRILSDKLADVVGGHLAAQAAAGADAVQLFDTWAETLAPDEYQSLALPGVVRAIKRFQQSSAVPLIYFARGTPHLQPFLGKTGANAYSVDWRVDLQDVRRDYPQVPLQGNLDPTLLFAPPAHVRQETRRVLDSLSGHGHIFNLGHGILPGTPLEGVSAMVETVTTWKS
ncbi:MAG: uroporphyrinogen decarboxylase [Thermoplasmatota archaeon]